MFTCVTLFWRMIKRTRLLFHVICTTRRKRKSWIANLEAQANKENALVTFSLEKLRVPLSYGIMSVRFGFKAFFFLPIFARDANKCR